MKPAYTPLLDFIKSCFKRWSRQQIPARSLELLLDGVLQVIEDAEARFEGTLDPITPTAVTRLQVTQIDNGTSKGTIDHKEGGDLYESAPKGERKNP